MINPSINFILSQVVLPLLFCFKDYLLGIEARKLSKESVYHSTHQYLGRRVNGHSRMPLCLPNLCGLLVRIQSGHRLYT